MPTFQQEVSPKGPLTLKIITHSAIHVQFCGCGIHAPFIFLDNA